MKLFFFDTETTGLNPDRDRIIQFWAIFWTLDEKTGKFHEERIINQYIKIKEEIPEQASNVHKIYNSDLEPFGYIQDYIKEFIAYIRATKDCFLELYKTGKITLPNNQS